MLTSTIFIWFLVLSVPTGVLMNKFGRRNTVILGVAATIAAMLIPVFGYNFALMALSFTLLGFGNTLLQVSINPLMMCVINPNLLASGMTFGQFVKSIASFCAPIIVAFCALEFGNWRLIYMFFGGFAMLPLIWLALSKIDEPKVAASTSGFSDCFALLKKPAIAALFAGILVHVGIDVGVNISAPKILMERAGLALEDAGYAASVYFVAKTVSCFAGAIILSKISARGFFIISVGLLAVGTAGLFAADSKIALFALIAVIGFGNANVFSIVISEAMQHDPTRNNEISGLMIMGIAGGGVFPIFMGIASDAFGTQSGAVAVIALCVAYLGFLALKKNGRLKNS